MSALFCALRLVCVLGFLCVAGCTSSSLDCPHTAGVSCQSLEQINRRIDAGSLPLLALSAQKGRLC